MKKLSLSQKMVLAIVLGSLLGITTEMRIAPYLAPLGKIFINLLKMVIVPLVISSITLGVAQIADLKQFGRLGTKVALFYFVGTIISACVAVAAGLIIQPGAGFVAAAAGKVKAAAPPPMADVIVAFVPSNIVQAMANMDMNALIFFSIMLGISLILIGDAKEPVVEVLKSLNEAMIKMTGICIQFAPIGVFALMANTTGKYGLTILKPLAKFFFTEYLAMAIVMFGLYGFIAHFIAKVNFIEYLRRIKDVMIMAVSTVSSAATLPLELEVATSKLGIPKHLAGFSLPLGATMNQHGAAINITICVLFSAQAFGLELGAGQILTIAFLAIIMSTGTSGVPSAGSVFTLMILDKFGLPSEAFAMILSVYVLVDMGSTLLNIVGDLICVNAVAESEGIQMREVWDNPVPAPDSSTSGGV
ncbi:MAG: dicarboxylate/amino acid:cation symporter [Firmicutes bacterium]|nr:dicarboxylate/amino acid:cation symporter [Bacillota bacterium]